MNRKHVQLDESSAAITRTIPCVNWRVDPQAGVAIQEESGARRWGLMTTLIVPRRNGITPGKKHVRFNLDEINEPTMRKESVC
jgi:hypothetical protein